MGWKERVKKRIEAVVIGLDWNSIKEIFNDRADSLTHQIYHEKLYFKCIFENDKCVSVKFAFEGVDDVCEWKFVGVPKIVPYKTSCGCKGAYDNRYKYCPYCSKRIKGVE